MLGSSFPCTEPTPKAETLKGLKIHQTFLLTYEKEDNNATNYTSVKCIKVTQGDEEYGRVLLGSCSFLQKREKQTCLLGLYPTAYLSNGEPCSAITKHYQEIMSCCRTEGLEEAVWADQGLSLSPDQDTSKKTVSFMPSCVGYPCVLLLISHWSGKFSSSPLSLLQGWWHLLTGIAFSPDNQLGKGWRGPGSHREPHNIQLKISWNTQAQLSFFTSKSSISKPWRNKRSCCLLYLLPIYSGYQLSQLYFSSSNTRFSLHMPRGKGYLGIRGVNSFPEALKQI